MTDIPGAIGSSYIVQAADLGSTIRIVVSRSGNLGSVTSDPTATVILPPLTGRVIIDGSAHVGNTLTANTAMLGGSGDISFQWRRAGADIAGATGQTYAVQTGDIGFAITVTVQRTGNSGYVTSDPAPDAILPPIRGEVRIGGVAQVGRILTADTSRLVGSGTTSYLWQRGSVNLGAANTLVIQPADTGYTITVTVSLSGNSGSITSQPTAAVIHQQIGGSVSINAFPPPYVGNTLTANTGQLLASGTVSFQWQRGGQAIGWTDISGAISNTYTVQDTDLGYAIRVEVSSTYNIGAVASNPTAVVTLPPITGSVSIPAFPPPHVGNTLTANTNALGGSGEVRFQWQRGTVDITGATGSTYTLQADDLDHTIRVVVSRSGNSGSIPSPATCRGYLAPAVRDSKYRRNCPRGADAYSEHQRAWRQRDD